MSDDTSRLGLVSLKKVTVKSNRIKAALRIDSLFLKVSIVNSINWKEGQING